ncbi:enoyl-CoA hydratase [Rhodospirillum rubrum]|uniref:bifunctional enoyl-CoA hydratase/phosphate acetyltransferase n=1 Tax=Rhodospirillum rubrum TaxID=1085 RepID=UPI0019084695|nr:bifunctional enoyl-CoA hydratase/phosphate acetyltransferase [Rhodospirillum rubrum]MBK1663196.1 enoyl-CoA hydratase [Rhodospirillum rubrum]MBK1676999.1 enoyl-CoA hydratase [Rhodospirillum rubrum]
MTTVSPDDSSPSTLTSLTFDDLTPGQSASLSRSLTQADLDLFATVSGNIDPSHFADPPAGTTLFPKAIGHGMWSASLISGVLGTRLPGPGTVYLAQDLRFRAPVTLGDTITASVTVREKRTERKTVVFECLCTNQNGVTVVSGTAEVIAPATHASVAAQALPGLQMIRHDRQAALLARCAGLPALPTAVIHPCDGPALQGAVEAAQRGLIEPILVGPSLLIAATAKALGLDISAFRLVEAATGAAAAAAGVALVRTGEARAVMKGALHTDELMAAVVKRDGGLRTAGRISHVFLMTVPTYPKPLLITDAVVNIAPSLEDKAHIVQNAIDLARILGVETPKVAILSAVETINPKISSTVDAAALCKMAQRGQIRGGSLDGPLAFDNAISAEAAKTKGIVSEVAGQADILLVPDLESGNMLAKQLSFLAHADAAGIVLGTSAPVMLTSRADNLAARLASCALAVLIDAASRPRSTVLAAE